MKFVSLHTHTTFSYLDGCAIIEKLIAKASEMGMRSIAITDHGNFSGAIEFYTLCKSNDINPIIGVEMYIDDSDDRRSSYYRHVILLAKNYKGYKNLLRIVSEANVRGFYYRPRTKTDLIFERSEGLIAMSACIGGLFKRMDYRKAKNTAKAWKNHFGRDFYMEIQINEIPMQKTYNKMVLEIAEELNIPPVITLDAHYVEPKDIRIQDFILAVRDKKTLRNMKGHLYEARNLYLMDEKQIWKNIKRWGHSIGRTLFNEMIETTNKISKKCDIKIPLGKIHIPDMGLTPDQFRQSVIYSAKALKFYKKEKYKVRLKRELDVINKLGFHDYFLIVSDIVDWCRENDIFVGPARGSVAGSLVSYAMGITKIDPIAHGLLFERFLNESRVDMPDIDLDFDNNKRDRVFGYIKKKHGANKVARVITFGTFGKVGAIKDVGRVFNLPIKQINAIASAIYKTGNLRDAYKSLSGLMKSFWGENKKYIKLAEDASGFIRNTGVHPCGTLVTPKPIYNYCPLQRVKGDIVAGYTEGERVRELSHIGLVKLDILGLNTCSIISDTIDLVSETEDIDLKEKVWRLNLRDKKLIKEVKKGNTVGGFQFETDSATTLLRKLKPNTFAEICAINAINRPGPLGSGAVERFLHHEGIGQEYKGLEKILKDTRGVLVFQEQVMQIFNWIGYSMVEADKLRKLAAHKMWKEGQVGKFKKDFLKRATKKIGSDGAIDLWQTIGEFTKYSFNRSHATAYAYLFFIVLYLKNKFPRQFFTSLLSNTATTVIKNKKHGSELNKLYWYINEARKYEVKIYQPDINKSGIGFTIEDKGIRFGLTKIKGIKDSSAEEIIQKRPYQSFSDFIARISGKVHKGKIIALVKAGCFDSLEDRESVKRQFNGQRKSKVFKLKSSFVEDSVDAFGFILLHPFMFDEVRDYLLSRYCVSSQQLRKFDRWESVGVAGIILSVDSPSTGKSSKVLKLQDHRGNLFVYLDKESDKRYSSILKNFNIVFIKGRFMGANRILCHGKQDKIINITSDISKLVGGDKWKSSSLV